ncbi:helix-turn-helix domain-containing protein [Acidithiobacillus sp.]|uniref:helix-turn-helix domain-containing protein n=2 Tax=Acidithiobacillus sp. TaxID=1872118 RepID=UPI003568DA43
MNITVPNCLYGNESGFSHFKTANLEIFRYHHRHIEVINEVILNKSLLLFVNSGVKKLKVSDEQTTISDLQGAFIPKGSYIMTEESNFALDGFESLMVLMSDEFLSNFYAQKTLYLPVAAPNSAPLVPWAKFEKTPFLDIAMLSFQAFFAHPERVNTLFLEDKVQEILLYLLDTDCSQQLLAHLRFTAAGGRNAKLRRFLESNYMQPWSVEDFADSFGLSMSTFKRECQNALGMSPKRWINHRRLDNARQKLRCSSAPLTQIAMELGFVDGSHFSRMFRKAFNCSPSDYRNLKEYRDRGG